MKKIMAHRGARNLWAENSLTGFRNVLDLDIDQVPGTGGGTDIQDGGLVGLGLPIEIGVHDLEVHDGVVLPL